MYHEHVDAALTLSLVSCAHLSSVLQPACHYHFQRHCACGAASLPQLLHPCNTHRSSAIWGRQPWLASFRQSELGIGMCDVGSAFRFFPEAVKLLARHAADNGQYTTNNGDSVHWHQRRAGGCSCRNKRVTVAFALAGVAAFLAVCTHAKSNGDNSKHKAKPCPDFLITTGVLALCRLLLHRGIWGLVSVSR